MIDPMCPDVQVQLTLSNRFVDLAEERLDRVIRELALRGAGVRAAVTCNGSTTR